jgi:DNA-binding NtrC family response regulator
MGRLLHDRYFAYAADHAWDLATGESVPLVGLDGRCAPLPAAPHAEPIVEMLDHGREGEPRRITLRPSGGESPQAACQRVAELARARGMVPIAADLYLRLRPLLAEELRHRTLLLIVAPGASPDRGRLALLDASADSPRPHVLLDCLGGSPSTKAAVVREARAAYGAEPAPRRRTDPPLSGDVLRQLARGQRWEELCRRGRHAAAERLLRDVAGALARRQAGGAAASTLVTLGRLVLERGRAAAADEIFADAAAQAQTAGQTDRAAGARVWQAAARTDAGQLTAAESLCRAALAAGALAAADRVRGEAMLVRVLLWQNRLDEAASRDLVTDTDDIELDACVGGLRVRVLLAQREQFAAGQVARGLLVRTEASGHAIARVMALVAHLRVLLESGDLALARQGLSQVQSAARTARTPIRWIRARLLFVDALRRAGLVREAERELRDLKRLRGVVPPLLRTAIDGRLRGDTRPAATNVSTGGHAAATALVAIARDEEDDGQAVRRLLVFAADQLSTSRLDVYSSDAGPDSMIASAGSGLHTSLGPRVLDAGLAIDGRAAASGGELGVPVRLGSRLVAALVARWPGDRVPPPFAHDMLTLTAAVAASRIESMHHAAREAARTSTAIPELVGSSTTMADVRRAVARAAAAPFSVLIEGESGSGKELVARALHQLSPRRERRFCDVNCAALPDDLLESELFGHVRGAFTGAVADRAGLIEEADGGTLFLDEVADLSARGQAKLLRVLQQQDVRRIGATVSRKVDIRVVSAANRDLRAEVADGRFRQDLLYRLDVVRIRVPPLRERPEDIPELAQHCWQQAAVRVGTRAVLSHAVVSALSRYHWPGNVRELQNVLAGLAVAAPARGQVRPGLLPAAVAGAAATRVTRLADARDDFERRFIQAAIARAGGGRSRAAKDLGLSRQGLLKMMIRLGIESP